MGTLVSNSCCVLWLLKNKKNTYIAAQCLVNWKKKIKKEKDVLSVEQYALDHGVTNVKKKLGTV